MMRVMPAGLLRDAWLRVTDPVFHDTLFPLMRLRLAELFKPFGGYTIDQLGEQAKRFGWSIGRRTYGRPLVMEPGRGNLTIGKYCALADPTIVLGNHLTTTSTAYPFMDLWTEWPGARPGLLDHVNRDVTIGNDVWIGFHTTILPGGRDRRRRRDRAGSVVRGRIPPYAICTGNPARVVRLRFPEAAIARLLAVRWWDWPDAKVSRHIPLLLDPDIERFLAAAEAEAT